MSANSTRSQSVVQTSNPKMATYHRSQSRVTKSGGSRFGIRLADVSAAVRYIVCCLARAVFKLCYLNPVSLILRRWRQLHHLNTRMALRVRPRLIDLATDFFLSDDRRKRQLLCWVKSILPWLEEEVFDFTACWQDGIVLCALIESISPGACPKFNLLKAHHRVNNCRMGIQLAMRYLHVTELPLSPEEMAIAEEDCEVKICHLVQLLKWKYQKQGSKPAVFSTVSLEQPAEGKCQARGTGIKAGIVGKRTKFNILTESVTNLDLLIEIRGPNNEYNKERIVSINTGVKSRFRDRVKAAVASASEEDGKRKIIDDGAGHSFVRQKSLDEDQGHLVIPFDYQCVGEGRFLATYIPRNPGLHAITVLSGGVHIAGSPFEVKVSNWVSSWNLLPKSPMVPFDMLKPVDETPQDPGKPTEQIHRKLSQVAHVSKQLTRMKRRILRKVITPNGEAIICDVTPTLSRQNSGELDLSGLGWSRNAHRNNKASRNNDKISENHTDTNHSIQQNTSAGTTESLKVSSDSTLALSESLKVSSDSTLALSESLKVSSDSTLALSESLKVSSDSTLALSESLKVSSDSTLALSESLKVSSDSTLALSESLKVSSDSTLALSESLKVSSDSTLALSESLKVSSDSTLALSSPLNNHKPSRNAGDAFVATVVAARIAMASEAEDINNSRTDLTNGAMANTDDSLLTSVSEVAQCKPLTSVSEDVQCKPLTSGFSTALCSNTETAAPQIVITPNFEAHNDGPGNETHVLIRQNTINENASNNGANDSTEPSIVMFSSVDNLSHCLDSRSGRQRAADCEWKNGQQNSKEAFSDLCKGDGSSKPPSPHLRVSDVVGTLLSNLKQDKHDQPVSPAHRHYLRSFSVDETHHHHHHEGSFNQGWSYSVGGSESPSVSTTSRHSGGENTSSYSRQHTLPALNDPGISLDDNCDNISQDILSNPPSIKSSRNRNQPSTDKLDDATAVPVPRDAQADFNTGNTYLGCLEEVDTKTCPELAGNHTSCGEIYCAGCTHCMQEPAIKKKDLDQRVYEIIEEISERDNDSMRHEDDISETSVDGIASDGIQFHEVNLDFQDETRLSTTYKSLADLTTDMVATRLPSYQTSLSFDISDIRPKHTILWSQSKSFSEERKLRKSLSYPYRADSVVDKEWADLTTIPLSNVTSDRHCSDAEDELFSSDSDQGNDNTLEETSRDDRQNRISSSANNLFNIQNLFDNNGNYEMHEDLSQTTVMSLVDMNDVHGLNSPNDVFSFSREETSDVLPTNDVFSFSREETSDVLPTTDKCNTFRAISSLHEVSAPDDLDRLNYIQNNMINEELDTEDDEILQIIIDESVLPSRINSSLGNSKTMPIPTSLESGVPDVCVNPAHAGDSFSVPQHDSTFDVNLNDRTNCVDTSPLSDVSNKSGNSDWSENENSPSRVTDYQKSTRRRSSTKGDWSPQLVDLTYNGSLVSEPESGIHNEAGPSRNAPNEDSNHMSYSTEESVTNPKINKDLSDSFQRKESTLLSHVHSGSRKTQGTQYELPSFPPADTEHINSQLSPKYSTEALLNNYQQTTSTMSGNQTLSYCSHSLGPCPAASNFSYGTVSDEHTVYVKRRRKPLYTSDNLTGNYQFSPGQVRANFHKEVVDTKHPVHNNILSEPQFPDRDDTNSFFATLRLLSPDLANCMSLDNWASSNIGGCVYDRSVYCENEYEDFSWSSTKMAQLQTNYFRERTLTPTKYRLRKQNTRRKVKSRQGSSGRDNTSSLEHRNTAYPLFAAEHTEDWADTEQEMVTLKLVSQPGSARVSLGLGDRTLTPTKYRRCVHDHDGHEQTLRTINPTEHTRQRQSPTDELGIPRHGRVVSSDDETLPSTKQPEASASYTGNHLRNSSRIKSHTIVSNKGAYYSDQNSFTPIGREINENLADRRILQNTIVPSCEKYRRNNIQAPMISSSHSVDNIQAQMTSSSLSAHNIQAQMTSSSLSAHNIQAQMTSSGHSADNIQAQMISSSHSADNIQTCLVSPGHGAPASSLSSRDVMVDENGCMLYVRKRRKIVLEKTDGTHNSANHNDNNKPSNLFDYQIADVELYDEDTQKTPSMYTDRFNPQRSQLQQHPLQLTYQHEHPSHWRQQHQTTAADSHHHTDDTCHSTQAFPHTNPPHFSSPRSPLYPQHYQEHPVEYLPRHLPMEGQVYNCNQHQDTARHELPGSNWPASHYHSRQPSMSQPRGRKVQPPQSDSCLDQGITARQRRHPPKLHLQTRQDFEHSQDYQEISSQRNSSLYQEHRHQEHLHQKHQQQEHLQLEQKRFHQAATQERHSSQPHREREGDEDRGNREVVLVRQSTLDTPDSGITDDSAHYCVPVTSTDYMEDRL